jgi:hypothetical protein
VEEAGVDPFRPPGISTPSDRPSPWTGADVVDGTSAGTGTAADVAAGGTSADGDKARGAGRSPSSRIAGNGGRTLLERFGLVPIKSGNAGSVEADRTAALEETPAGVEAVCGTAGTEAKGAAAGATASGDEAGAVLGTRAARREARGRVAATFAAGLPSDAEVTRRTSGTAAAGCRRMRRKTRGGWVAGPGLARRNRAPERLFRRASRCLKRAPVAGWGEGSGPKRGRRFETRATVVTAAAAGADFERGRGSSEAGFMAESDTGHGAGWTPWPEAASRRNPRQPDSAER